MLVTLSYLLCLRDNSNFMVMIHLRSADMMSQESRSLPKHDLLLAESQVAPFRLSLSQNLRSHNKKGKCHIVDVHICDSCLREVKETKCVVVIRIKQQMLRSNTTMTPHILQIELLGTIGIIKQIPISINLAP